MGCRVSQPRVTCWCADGWHVVCCVRELVGLLATLDESSARNSEFWVLKDTLRWVESEGREMQDSRQREERGGGSQARTE